LHTPSAELAHNRFPIVMAGLVPAIHDLSRGTKNVDARDKPGHDEFVALGIRHQRELHMRLPCRSRGAGQRETRQVLPARYGRDFRPLP
jgi:hypothetical protein